MAEPRHLGSLMLAALLVVSAVAMASASTVARGASVRGPIRIEGNAGFTASNGVVSGSGTATDPYVIEGWDIDASISDGIVLRNTTAPLVVREVTVHSGGLGHNGMVLENATSVSVGNATLSFDASGIVVRSCRDIALTGNAVTRNTWDGIAILDSRTIRLNGNNVTYNRDGAYVQGSSGILVQGSAFWLNGQDGAFLANVTDVDIEASTFSSNAWAGLHLAGASNVTMRVNLVFSNGRDGIAVDTGSQLFVRASTVFSNQGGIRLSQVSDASVELNDLSANRDSGIIVEAADGVSIRQNLVSASGYGGIVLGSVSNVTAEGNRVSNSDYGLSFLLVSRARLRFNNVTSSRANGIYLAGADNVTVESNNASRNTNGIAVESTTDATFRRNVIAQNEFGMYLFRSSRIVVAGNRFDFNTVQALDDAGPVNRWDDGYPSGGNFWSAYHGPDRCSGPNQSVCVDPDGIGDLPFYVDTDTVDHYPLMRPPGLPNSGPVASFVIEPPTGNTTTTFTFDASSAYEVADGASTLEVRWDFDGDGVWDSPWTHQHVAEHVFSQPGDYLVRLEVRDYAGVTNGTSLTLHVNVAPGPPPGLALDAFSASVLLLAGAAVAVGIGSYVRFRRRRPVARPAWRLPPRARP